MALTGFEPEKVSGAINSVKVAYGDLIEAIGTNMQLEFVNGMKDKWACPQAQTFFTVSFKPAMDKLISEVNVIFESIVASMNSAAQRWALDTGATYTNVSFQVISKTMDVSGILENINGVRGIDKENANSVAAGLSNIVELAKSALINASNAVQGSGFVGGSQESNLILSLDSIKTSIENTITQISADTQTAISDTVAVYEDTAGKVSQAFLGQ